MTTRSDILKSILLPLGLSLIGLFALTTLVLINIYHHHNQVLIHNIHNQINTLFSYHLMMDKEKLNLALDFLQQNQMLQRAWLARDRQQLLALLTPQYPHLRDEHRITHLYFIEPDQRCFLRVHQPLRQGDTITRFTMQAAAAGDTRNAYGIELGPLGTFTLRVVKPWFIQDQLAGYLEAGEEIDHFIQNMSKTLDIDFAVVINKNFVQHQGWTEGMAMLNRPANWNRLAHDVVIQSTGGMLDNILNDYMSSHQLISQQRVWTKYRQQNQIFRVNDMPLIDAGGRTVGRLIAQENITEAEKGYNRLLALIIGLSVTLSCLFFIGFYFYLMRLHRKLQRSYQEVQQLSLQLAQAQKMESVGQLAAGVAHEINTPIQYIGDNIRYLNEAFGEFKQLTNTFQSAYQAFKQNRLTDDTLKRLDETIEKIDLEFTLKEFPQAVNQSLEGIERVASIVRALKGFAHPDESDEKKPVDLNQAVTNTMMVARSEWKYVAEVDTRLDPELPLVTCLPSEINQVLLNLIVNASHAIDESLDKASGAKGLITITTEHQAPMVRITIADTGAGIPMNIRDKIFNPFFTTKEVGKGTGQGLALAYKFIVDKHGGRLEFTSTPGQGTSFIIILPVTPVTKEKSHD